jgi:hypothetical protein
MATSIREPWDEGVIRSVRVTSPCPKSSGKWILAATILGSSLAFIASGINNAVSRAAGLLAIAVLGIVMLHIFNRSLDSRLAKLDVSPSIGQFLSAQRARLAGVEFSELIPAHTRDLLTDAINRSFIGGFVGSC